MNRSENAACTATFYLRLHKQTMAADDVRSMQTLAVGGHSSLSLQELVVSLYKAHRESIFRFLVGHGLNPGETKEVTQDVFVDLFQALQKGTNVNFRLLLKPERIWAHRW